MADIRQFLDKSGVSILWNKVAEKVEAEATRAKAAEAAALKAGQDAQADVDALETLVGSLPEGAEATTVIGYIDEKAGKANTDLKTLEGTVEGHTAALELLNGNAETAGSVAHTATSIAATKVAEIVAGADANFDTLKEIADWILNDTTGAADMANDIAALQAQMVGVDTTVVAEIASAIEAALKVEGVEKYALATELSALATRVKALEDAGYQNAAQVGSAIDAKIAALKLDETYDAFGSAATAEQNAKNYADSLAKNYDEAGAAAQALTDAKAYTDTEVAKIQALSEAEILEAIGEAQVEA